MNFEQKIVLVGQFLENNTIIERRTKAEKETESPTKFHIVIRDGELKCVWSRNLRYKKMEGKRVCTDKLLFGVGNPTIGLEPAAWTQLTKDLIELEQMLAGKGIVLPWNDLLRVRDEI